MQQRIGELERELVLEEAADLLSVLAVAIENREEVRIGDAANPGHRQRTVLVLEVTLAAFAVHPEGHMRMIAVWPIAEI